MPNMNRNTWDIYTQTGSGGSWELTDAVFYRPNENMEQVVTSTIATTQLANGANAFVSSEVKYNYDPITMSFLALEYDDEFRALLADYVKNGTYLKIVDQENNEMIGMFSNVSQVWLSGMDNTVDLSATFIRMG